MTPLSYHPTVPVQRELAETNEEEQRPLTFLLHVAPKGLTVTRWIKRLGIVGFAFFFVKGMIWLGILFGAHMFLTRDA